MTTHFLSLGTKLLRTFLIAFGVALPIVIIVGGLGSVLLMMSGAGRIIPQAYEAIGSFGIIGAVLLAAVVLGAMFSALVAIPIWIFHKGPAPADAPSSWRALVPDLGITSTCAAIAISGLYLIRPPLIYRHWQWMEYLPLAGAILLVGGALLATFHWRRIRHALPDAWWRLRAVLLLLGAGLAISAIDTMRKELHDCSRDVLNAIISTGNATALDRHIIRHSACQEGQLNGAMHEVALNIVPVGTTASQEQRHLVLATLQRHGGTLSQGSWEVILRMRGEETIRELLAVLREASPQAAVWAKKNLGESVVKWADENNVAMLSLFVEHGMRFDTPEWRDAAFDVMHTALAKKKPSWAFYDALVGAGLPVSARMRTLTQAIRTGSTASLHNWTRQDWQSRVIDGDADADNLLWAAAIYTQNDVLRTELLSMAGTDMQQLAAATPLPQRCGLALRMGAAPIRAMLTALPALEKNHCEDYLYYLEVLERQ